MVSIKTNIPTHQLSAQVFTRPDLSAKTQRAVDLASRARTDTFGTSTATTPAFDLAGRASAAASRDVAGLVGVTSPGAGPGGGAPAVPGRRPANELNPFDASSLPSRGRGNGILAELELGRDPGAVSVQPDHDTRLAELRTELDDAVGLHSGPNHNPSAADVGVNWDNVHGAMINGAIGGAIGGLTAAATIAAASAGGAAPSAPIIVLGAAAGGAIAAGYGTLAQEMYNDKREQDRKDAAAEAAKSKAPPPKPAPTPPPKMTPGSAAVPPPKDDKEKKDPPPPPPPPPPKVDEKAMSSWDPMRSSGGSYEAYRQAYLGHADGTPIGARGTSVSSGASNPRNTNPGRDQADEQASTGAAPHSVGEVTLQADPMRGLKADARAAKLRNEGGVSSRLIITDPDAEQARPGNTKPKSNGLVR